MPIIDNSCHCGNLQARMETKKQPQDMWLRARSVQLLPQSRHALAFRCARAIGDSRRQRCPGRPLPLRPEDGGLPPICRTRGNYIGAVQEGEGRLYGSVNVDLTRDRGAQFGEAEHRFHENETGEERSALGAAQIGPDAAHTHRRR